MQNHFLTREHILDAAKKEFMEKGFQKASLRNIVKNAGVTTGAFYGYYKSKAALFEDLVKGPAEGFFNWYDKVHRDYMEKPAWLQKEEMRTLTDEYIPLMIDYIYEHFDAFKLIFCCSAGTGYESYLDRLVAVEQQSSWEYIEELQKTGYEVTAEIDDTLLHVICSSYFQALREMVAHDVEKEKALAYMKALGDFQYGGWFTMLGL